jgi:hypothetical protein
MDSQHVVFIGSHQSHLVTLSTVSHVGRYKSPFRQKEEYLKKWYKYSNICNMSSKSDSAFFQNLHVHVCNNYCLL